jgi:hypothetical protein
LGRKKIRRNVRSANTVCRIVIKVSKVGRTSRIGKA